MFIGGHEGGIRSDCSLFEESLTLYLSHSLSQNELPVVRRPRRTCPVLSEEMPKKQEEEEEERRRGGGGGGEGIDSLNLSGLVVQLSRRVKRKGIRLNLMLIGQSGLGKSTFVRTLFGGLLCPSSTDERCQTMRIQSREIEYEHGDLLFHLNLIDTPGFGDSIDNSHCWKSVVQWIDERYEEYFLEEHRVQRRESPLPDNRIHLCLYFLPSTGHRLHRLDLECLKHLSCRVNVLPLLSKGDTFTREELIRFRQTVKEEFLREDLQFYPNRLHPDSSLPVRYPLSIVGSNSLLPRREYPWGTVQIDNVDHCDFLALKSYLFDEHYSELEDVTNTILYENYRRERFLSFWKINDDDDDEEKELFSARSILAPLEDQRRANERRLNQIQEELDLVYQHKLKDKLNRLELSQANLCHTRETFRSLLEEEHNEYHRRLKLFHEQRQQEEESLLAKKAGKRGLF